MQTERAIASRQPPHPLWYMYHRECHGLSGLTGPWAPSVRACMLPSDSYPACQVITGGAALLVCGAASAVLKLQEEARAEEARDKSHWASSIFAGSACLQVHRMQSL